MNNKYYIISLICLLQLSCNDNKNDIEKILTNNNYRYWRLYWRDLGDSNSKSNSLLRFDKDGSLYEIRFRFDELKWELKQEQFSSGTNFCNNCWIINRDSIYFDCNYYKVLIFNQNTDSMCIVFDRKQTNSYLDSKNNLRDSTIRIYYSLYPFKEQIDYFNYDSIKQLNGTNRFFDKKLRDKKIREWMRN